MVNRLLGHSLYAYWWHYNKCDNIMLVSIHLKVCHSILYHHDLLYLHVYLFAVTTDVIPHYPHPPITWCFDLIYLQVSVHYIILFLRLFQMELRSGTQCSCKEWLVSAQKKLERKYVREKWSKEDSFCCL